MFFFCNIKIVTIVFTNFFVYENKVDLYLELARVRIILFQIRYGERKTGEVAKYLFEIGRFEINKVNWKLRGNLLKFRAIYPKSYVTTLNKTYPFRRTDFEKSEQYRKAYGKRDEFSDVKNNRSGPSSSGAKAPSGGYIQRSVF